MNRQKIFFGWSVALILAAANCAWSQLQQPFRFEHEIKNSEEGFNIISLKKEGLALMREMNQYSHGKKKWQLEILDTALSQVWSPVLELENRLVLVGFEYSPQLLYLLFREGENEAHNFQLLTVRFPEKSYQIDKIKFELNFKMTHFTMAGNTAVFGGYVNNESAVLLYDQSSEHPKVIPGLFITDISLLDVRANQNQSFNVLLTEGRGKEKKRLIVRTFDSNGNQLMDDAIRVEPRFTILTGLTNSLERDEMIIVGTYAEGTGKQASGFYSVVVDPFNDQAVTYTDFTTLSHFLDYLPPRKAEKIRTKAQQQRTLGRMPDYKTYVVPFRMEERSNGFYILAEQYYPSNSVNTSPYPYSSFNPYAYGYYPYGQSPYMNRYYNSPYMYNTPVRNSDVRMVQTMVLELGPHGKVVKDASIKLEDIKQPGLEQVGDFLIAHDSILLVYKKESEIIYQEEAGDLDEKPILKKTKLRLLHEGDVLRNENENEGGVRFWYDHNFYVWGYQTVKDATRAENQTRHVFYVNRITME